MGSEDEEGMTKKALLHRPHGFDQIIKTFGDPRKYLRTDGTISPKWEATVITRVALPEKLLYLDAPHEKDRVYVTRVACHALIANAVKAAFGRIHDDGNWKLLTHYGGSYNPRMKRLSRKLSTHLWGIAFDLNDEDNEQGTPGHMPEDIITAFESQGFYWGGNFSGNSRDPMHFQFADGY
jgi:hypothetical protein